MKKKEIYIVLIVIVITLFIIITSTGVVRLQTISGISSESYYDEKCIDVTQYYSQGYTNVRLDDHGCQIAGISKITATINLGQFIGNKCFGGSYWRISGGTNNQDVCKMQLGDGWIGSCSNSPSSNSYKEVLCNKYGFDEVGGFERVLNYCTYDAGDILVAESFAGSKVITKNDLRYPIKTFCRAHPSIITTELTTLTSTNIPQDLIDGKSVTISTGQTLTVFYTINNIYNLPNRCSPSNNEALSLADNYSCSSTIGFTYLCTDGIWDAKTGSCTVTKVAECDLNMNERLVINSDGSKVCIYNPPLQVECAAGYSFDLTKNSCYKVAESENICTNSLYTLFEPTQSQCIGNWEICPQCPTDKICDQSICKAQCSEGIKCIREINVDEMCTDGIISGQYCVINETKIRLCPLQDEVWDTKLKSCVVDASKQQSCTNGGLIDGICYNIPTGYKICSSSQVLNSGECVDMAQLSNASISNYNYVYLSIIIALLFTVIILYKRKK